MTTHSFFGSLIVLLSWVGFIFSTHSLCAQEEPYSLTDDRAPYLGVNPALRNYAPGKTVKSKKGQQKITWIGFQAQGDRGHVFIQSDQPPLYEVSKSSDDRVLIDFPSATLHTRNDARNLDTGFFPTMVRYVKATQVSRSIVRVTIKLRRPSTGYKVKKDKEMLHFYFNPPKSPIDVLEERERELDEAAQRGQVTEYKVPVPSKKSNGQGNGQDKESSPSSNLINSNRPTPSLNPK